MMKSFPNRCNLKYTCFWKWHGPHFSNLFLAAIDVITEVILLEPLTSLEGRRYTSIGHDQSHTSRHIYSFVPGISPSWSIYLVLDVWNLEGCNFEREKMGDVLLIFLIFLCVLLLSWIWKSFYTNWWRPMKLQRYLNQQGIHGHPYKLFYGNFKDLNRSTRQAQSQPINLTHKIVSRVLPFLDQTVKSYGMSWVTFL